MAKGNRSLKIFLILLALVVIVLIIGSMTKFPLAGWLKEAFSDLGAWLARPFLAIGQWIAETWSHLTQFSSLTENLEKFRQENEKLLSEIALLKQASQENETLRALLNLKQSLTSFETKAAAVLAGDSSPYVKSILIDAGEKDGLTMQTPVLAANGALVGQVIEVYPTKARVLLLVDLNSFVSGRIQSTGELAVVKGDGEENCFFERLMKETKMKAGDLVVTSGEGGIFPPGLPIGEIQEVYVRSPLYLEAVLKPLADFSNLNFVMIVKEKAP